MVNQADALQAKGDALLAPLESWRPEEDKEEGWSKQDQATSLRRSADLKRLSVDQGLHGALRVAPGLPEAHAALAQRYLARHALAEANRDAEDAARAEALVRFHTSSLPHAHETRARCTAYLKGDGALTLVTDPPGADVMLYRYEVRNRRRVEVPVRALGKTPLNRVSLPMGSYVCVVQHPDRPPVRYPAEVPRQGHWDGVAPGDHQATPVWLPPKGYLGDDEIYLPSGWFRSGGDPKANFSHPARRLWCDAMVMQRFPVTNQAYMAFLDDLVAQGREDEALAHAPRERAGVASERGALIYGFDGTRFSLQEDADTDAWLPDWPVLKVDWYGACAYLAWWAVQSARPWRLPGELEWEKAARGVDGRWYPWGDRLDPSWCHMTRSHPAERLPTVIDSYPVDVSPFGLRGAGGNVYEWCLNRLDTDSVDAQDRVLAADMATERQDDASLRTTRGGAWSFTARDSRSADRGRTEPTARVSNLGFRGLYRVSETRSATRE
jgi:serine/threonine-protein kinase